MRLFGYRYLLTIHLLMENFPYNFDRNKTLHLLAASHQEIGLGPQKQ